MAQLSVKWSIWPNNQQHRPVSIKPWVIRQGSDTDRSIIVHNPRYPSSHRHAKMVKTVRKVDNSHGVEMAGHGRSVVARVGPWVAGYHGWLGGWGPCTLRYPSGGVQHPHMSWVHHDLTTARVCRWCPGAVLQHPSTLRPR